MRRGPPALLTRGGSHVGAGFERCGGGRRRRRQDRVGHHEDLRAARPAVHPRGRHARLPNLRRHVRGHEIFSRQDRAPRGRARGGGGGDRRGDIRVPEARPRRGVEPGRDREQPRVPPKGMARLPRRLPILLQRLPRGVGDLGVPGARRDHDHRADAEQGQGRRRRAAPAVLRPGRPGRRRRGRRPILPPPRRVQQRLFPLPLHERHLVADVLERARVQDAHAAARTTRPVLQPTWTRRGGG